MWDWDAGLAAPRAQPRRGEHMDVRVAAWLLAWPLDTGRTRAVSLDPCLAASRLIDRRGVELSIDRPTHDGARSGTGKGKAIERAAALRAMDGGQLQQRLWPLPVRALGVAVQASGHLRRLSIANLILSPYQPISGLKLRAHCGFWSSTRTKKNRLHAAAC